MVNVILGIVVVSVFSFALFELSARAGRVGYFVWVSYCLVFFGTGIFGPFVIMIVGVTKGDVLLAILGFSMVCMVRPSVGAVVRTALRRAGN